MATNTTTTVPSIYPNTLSAMDLDTEEREELAYSSQAGREDRSSSLSELGDRADQEQPDRNTLEESDANDTEAETERLEDSPQRQGKHQNIVLTASIGIHNEHRFSLAGNANQDLAVQSYASADLEKLERSSDISSLVDSGEEVDKVVFKTMCSPKKRKRSTFDDDKSVSPEPDVDAYKKGAELFGGTPAGSPLTLEEDASQVLSAEEENHISTADAATFPSDESPQRKSHRPAPAKQKYTKGKRKGRKALDEDPGTLADRDFGTAIVVEHARSDEAVSSNGEEAEGDEGDEGRDVPEQENAVKTEEGLVQKKTALDYLNSLEKSFATLRDKLFDERLAQCNEELAMLESPVLTHPDLLNMKEAIDQRRDDKIQYEDTLMKFKLQTLQRESVANKAQGHSQYMQTARDVRDHHLNKLNKEWYQYQRERRSCEGDVPDFAFTYTAKRSQQITQQTAYNAEVSVLSGVAKYRGFPAAPYIAKARSNEVEDDLRNMGVALRAPQTLQNRAPAMRASLSATASFPRQNAVAEEHSFEQQAWANPLSHPRHPSHQQQRQQMHRNVSALSRAATPSQTPAAQRRVVDLTEPQGSASTIAESQSGPSSSMAATPATGEVVRPGQVDQRQAIADKLIDSTPSRTTGASIEFMPSHDKGKTAESSRTDKNNSPALGRLAQEVHTPNALPKPLPFFATGGSTTGNRASTPGRYPVIKAEDASQLPRHSSMPHQYNVPPAVPSGQVNRFTA